MFCILFLYYRKKIWREWDSCLCFHPPWVASFTFPFSSSFWRYFWHILPFPNLPLTDRRRRCLTDKQGMLLLETPHSKTLFFLSLLLPVCGGNHVQFTGIFFPEHLLRRRSGNFYLIGCLLNSKLCNKMWHNLRDNSKSVFEKFILSSL